GADGPTPPPDVPTELPRRWAMALIGTHLLTFAAFLAVSFHLRTLVRATGVTQEATTLVWGALGAVSFGLLAAFGLYRTGSVDIRGRALGPVSVGAVAGIAAWVAGKQARGFWSPLSTWTLRGVASLVRLFSTDLVLNAEHLQVGTSRFFVNIAPV